MSVEVYTSLISNVGFPIAAFLLMYHLATNTIKENTEALRDLKNEINQLRTDSKI